MTEIPQGFEHDREFPAEWMRDLREVSPEPNRDLLMNGQAHGFLHPVWEPGDPWLPAQRWMLYEMIHPSLIDPELRKELRGPNPRSEGHMCTTEIIPWQDPCLCPYKLEGWRGGPCEFITLTQWKLFQRTGLFGRPFWVIQGSGGGHRAFLTEEEIQFLQIAEKEVDLPAPGELPYAPFDARVIKHIVRSNRLRAIGDSLREYRKRMGPDYQKHRKDAEKELRRQFVTWIDEQMQDVNEGFIAAAKSGEMDDQPKTDIDWEKVTEESMPHYIEHGQLLHPSKVK